MRPRKGRGRGTRAHALAAFVAFTLASLTAAVTDAARAQRGEEGERRIDGRVEEHGLDDYGVPEATIRVEGSEAQTLTDDDGRFALEGLEPGPLTLVVEAEGYTPARVEVADGTTRVSISLRYDDDDDYSVTATVVRAAETASTTDLSPRGIRAAPLRTAEDALRQVPGMTLVQHGSEGKGHQFFLRGFDAIHGADLALTVAGIPVNEWSNVHAQGYLDIGFVLPEMISGLRVTKGPFMLDQGAFAMAGSADYRLGVSPDALGLRAAYTAGTTNRHRVFVGYAPESGGGDTFVGAALTHDDGYGQRRGIRRAVFNARAPLYDARGGRLELVTLASAASFELPGTVRNEDVAAGRIGFLDAYDTRQRGESARAMLALRHRVEFDGGTARVLAYGGYRRLRLRENFTGFLLDPVNGDRRAQQQDAWSYGVRAASQHRLRDGLWLRARLGLRGDTLTQGEDNVGQALEVIDTRRDLEATQLLAHAALGLRWVPSDAWHLDLGVRGDVMHVRVTDRLGDVARGDGTRGAVSPRMSATYAPSDTLTLFGSYGRGFRPPEARAFSSFDAGMIGIDGDRGDEAAMTTSDAAEVGLRARANEYFSCHAALFATRIARESVFDHVSGTSLSLRGTRRLGAELVARVTPADWLDLSADMPLADARFRASGERVPFAPWLVAGLRGMLTHDSGVEAGLRVVGLAPRPLPNGARGATLLMADATLGYRWRALRLHLEVENLLGRRIREGEFHYASHWERDATPSALPALHTTGGAPLNARLTVSVTY